MGRKEDWPGMIDRRERRGRRAGSGEAGKGQIPARWLFGQLVETGLIRPRRGDVWRIILKAPPSWPRES